MRRCVLYSSQSMATITLSDDRCGHFNREKLNPLQEGKNMPNRKRKYPDIQGPVGYKSVFYGSGKRPLFKGVY